MFAIVKLKQPRAAVKKSSRQISGRIINFLISRWKWSRCWAIDSINAGLEGPSSSVLKAFDPQQISRLRWRRQSRAAVGSTFGQHRQVMRRWSEEKLENLFSIRHEILILECRWRSEKSCEIEWQRWWIQSIRLNALDQLIFESREAQLPNPHLSRVPLFSADNEAREQRCACLNSPSLLSIHAIHTARWHCLRSMISRSSRNEVKQMNSSSLLICHCASHAFVSFNLTLMNRARTKLFRS